MKRYPKYKDSGIDWLGEIPEHWEILPTFAVFREQCFRNKKMLEKNLLSLSYGKIIRKDFETNSGLLPESFETYQIVMPGNIILRLTDLQNDKKSLRVGLVKERGIITSAYLCLRLKNAYEEYLYNLLHNYDILKIFYTMGSGVRQNMTFKDLKWLPILVPPLCEQKTIACFIDRKLVQIDQFISNKQRFIELLKEQKRAIVNRAVTKGLNPDAPMKPSGIEWLGDIPEGWEVERIGRLSESLQTGPFGSQLHSHEYVSGGIPVINPSNMKDSRIFPDFNCAVDNSTWERLKRHALKIGDIIFARRGEMGRCALVTQKEKGWICGTGSLRMRPKREKTISEFLIMVLSAKGVAEYLSLMSVGSTMENLNTGILQRLPLPIPPLDEQKRIIELIQKKSLQIDLTITKAKQEIELIQEYRTTLISDAVTGKIDVREFTHNS